MRRGTISLLAMLLAAAPVLAQTPPPRASPVIAEKTVDVLRVFPMLDRFLSIPPADRSKLALGYEVRRDGRPGSDVGLTLLLRGHRVPLPIAPDGKVMRLPTSGDLAEKAQVLVSAPKDSKLAIQLDFGTSISPTNEISAADCDLAVSQAANAIKKAAGMIGGFLAPHVSRVSFPNAEGGVALGVDGRVLQPLPQIAGVEVYEPGHIKGARTLRFTKPPSVVKLD